MLSRIWASLNARYIVEFTTMQERVYENIKINIYNRM